MPELPEVETVKRQLLPVLLNRAVQRARVLDPLCVAPASPQTFQRRIRGQVIAGISRRGKYLRLGLASGDTLVIHLRMTGRLTHGSEPFAKVDRRHLRLFFWLDDGTGLSFHDQRRFGKALILRPDESEAYWRRLGAEPLERSFNRRKLFSLLKGRNRPIKPLLLDQSLIAGIGNIYADEALFRASIHPLRTASEISEAEAGRLLQAIKETLKEAIALEGSSVDTYRTATGGRGSFQETFRVHRRASEACPVCGGAVAKIKVGGRGTYFCPRCQKLGR